jgi:transaldolase
MQMDRLNSVNFSLWCDFVEREFLDEAFEPLLKRIPILKGATSNPAIFQSAFANSTAYIEDKKSYSSLQPKEIYEELACYDITLAANKLENLYKAGKDGFISLEVDPYLSNDAKGTVAEGIRLYNKIAKPNVMIKVPATDAGFEAMEELMSQGINVNATLIFSPAQAKGCLDAMKRGLSRCENDLKPKAVISIFVSRFDRKLDEKLIENGVEASKVGIYNAINIYQMIEKENVDEIRALFASTGVKGDTLPADYYITQLLFPNAINTAPISTIDAFVDTQKFELSLLPQQDIIDQYFQKVKDAGIDMEQVNRELMHEGLVAFEKAFDDIIRSLE